MGAWKVKVKKFMDEEKFKKLRKRKYSYFNMNVVKENGNRLS